MKKLFFTSNTKHYYKDNDMKLPKEIDNTNGIVDQIKKLINDDELYNRIIYENPEKVLNNEKINIWYPKSSK